MRRLTRLMWPIALRTAGRRRSKTAVVHHVGRRSGRSYTTPEVAAEDGDGFLIALPQGARTDWLRNVLASGEATLVADGYSYRLDRPEVVPMAQATGHFRAREQRLHRRFRVDSALRLHRT